MKFELTGIISFAHLNANIKPDWFYKYTYICKLLKWRIVEESSCSWTASATFKQHSTLSKKTLKFFRVIKSSIWLVWLVDSFHITVTGLEHLAVCGAAFCSIQDNNFPVIMLVAFVCLSAGLHKKHFLVTWWNSKPDKAGKAALSCCKCHIGAEQ